MNSVIVKNAKVPRVLLIGAGKFGVHYIRILKQLHNIGTIDFVGVVVQKKSKLRDWSDDVPTFVSANISELIQRLSVTAVFIVTPPDSHFDLVEECIKLVDVFVEKPLAMNETDVARLSDMARENNKHLMTGHIFRFHPLSEELIKAVSCEGVPTEINGVFVNPVNTDKGRDISLELLHLFDLVDLLFNREAVSVYSQAENRLLNVDVRYKDLCDAHFLLGWNGDRKERTLSIIYNNFVFEADFSTGTLTKNVGGIRESVKFESQVEPLRKEIIAFIDLINGNSANLVSPDVAGRVISVARMASKNKSVKKRRSKVAVIGGGIFGSSLAVELDANCDVVLFEKNSELLQEASFVNCYRHHIGHHYPRSDKTVKDIQNSRMEFEAVYGDSLRVAHAAFYSLAKDDSKVTKEEFLEFCARNNLPCEAGYPDASVIDREMLQYSVKVNEPIYHFPTLKSIVCDRLNACKNVDVMLNTRVTDYVLMSNGKKMVQYEISGSAAEQQEFDYVINATYANINHLTQKLSLPTYPIRIDVAEVLAIILPIEPISVTVIDGPFVSLVPTGNKNEFTLYHAAESILDRYTPLDGLIKSSENYKSNKEAILRESTKFLPIIKDAIVVESRIAHRGVLANHEHDDARVADIIDHGFGCWSVLSGKILSSVSLSKRIAQIITKIL